MENCDNIEGTNRPGEFEVNPRAIMLLIPRVEALNVGSIHTLLLPQKDISMESINLWGGGHLIVPLIKQT